MELDEAVLYRLAYGLADQIHEAERHNMPGRWRSNLAAGGDVEAILTEVARRLPVNAQVGRGLVRDAVEDVVEGRRPRW